MNNIIVQHKPDYISWEQIAKCHQSAHNSNKDKGINMLCADYTAYELKKEVGDGICLVATDSNQSLMGTLSIKYRDLQSWYYDGRVAYICFVAVAPEYKGRGVYKALSYKANQIILEQGVNVEYLHTHIKNKIARLAYLKDGYKLVRLIATGGGAEYYSVEMAKWLKEPSPNKLFLKLRYFLSYIIIKCRYKPGPIKRFGI